MSAHNLNNELSFSQNPKLVGERNPDSVLFKIGELEELGEFDDDRPPARGLNEVVDDNNDDDDPAVVAMPCADAPEAEEQERAASSGLVNVQDLLDSETEAANAVPSAPINPGLIPESEPRPQAPDSAEVAAPVSKVPTVMAIAGAIAVLIAAFAVITAMG